MRLTADLINSSLSYINAVKERELDLRGHKIPNVENLGAAAPHDAIDFTDNDLTTLTNFPMSPRLNTLLCARNRISSIDRRLSEQIPNLTTLMLANNHIRELADLEALTRCRKLENLVLKDNPVARTENYRAYLIWSIPSLRFIDYSKVRKIEKEQAEELFGTLKEPSELALKIRGKKSTGAAAATTNGRAPQGGSKSIRTVLSETEKKRLKELLDRATSTAEVDRIARDLNEGRIPHGIADADRMMS